MSELYRGLSALEQQSNPSHDEVNLTSPGETERVNLPKTLDQELLDYLANRGIAVSPEDWEKFSSRGLGEIGANVFARHSRSGDALEETLSPDAVRSQVQQWHPWVSKQLFADMREIVENHFFPPTSTSE